MGYGPRDQKPDVVERFVCPPERSISIPLEEILADFKGRISPDQHDDFDYMIQMLEALAQLDYVTIGRRLKNSFRLFSDAVSGLAVPSKRDSARPSEVEIDAMEQKFVEDIWQLLGSAHYRLLSQDEWVTALKEDFTFNMPVEVTWDKISDQLLKAFWSRHLEEREGLADISDHILVFHRGIKEVRAQGMFINEKLDLLTQYLVMEPISALLAKWAPTLRDYAKQANSYLGSSMINNRQLDAWFGSEAPAEQSISSKRQVAQKVNGVRTMETASGMPNRPANEAELLHANAKHVERLTLSKLMPDAGAVLSQATSMLTIKEPAFNDVVILYRRKVAAKPTHDEHDELNENYDKTLAARNIHLKAFSVVPMADCEMLFPDKRVYIKSFVMIQLVVTVAIGLFTAMLMLLSNRLDRSLVLSVLGTIFGRAFQVYTTAQYQKQRTIDSMTERLYEKTQDAQVGVIYRLLNQMAEQHIKQNVMAYFILLVSGQSFTPEELDRKCEMYLDRHFRVKLDFALENTLPGLIDDGLICSDHQGCLHAVPLNEGINSLTRKWTSLFKYSAAGDYEGAGLPSFRQAMATQANGVHPNTQQPAQQLTRHDLESQVQVAYPQTESRPQPGDASINSSTTSMGSRMTFVESDYNPAETSRAAKIAAEADAELRSRGLRSKIKSAMH